MESSSKHDLRHIDMLDSVENIDMSSYDRGGGSPPQGHHYTQRTEFRSYDPNKRPFFQSKLTRYVFEGGLVVCANLLYWYVVGQGCEERADLADCLDNYLWPHLPFNVLYIAICAAIFTYFIWKNLTCKNAIKAVTLAILIVDLLILVLSNTTISVRRLNGMYALMLVVMVLTMLAVLMSYAAAKRLKAYLNKKVYAVFGLLILTLGLYVYYYHMVPSCVDWEYGLTGSLLHSQEFCQIEPPKICFYEISDNWQDFSKKDCSSSRSDPELMQQCYKTDAPFIGLPDTSEMSESNRTFTQFPYSIWEDSKSYYTLEAAKAAGHTQVIDVEGNKIETEV
jgi:hypothetical protein